MTKAQSNPSSDPPTATYDCTKDVLAAIEGYEIAEGHEITVSRAERDDPEVGVITEIETWFEGEINRWGRKIENSEATITYETEEHKHPHSIDMSTDPEAGAPTVRTVSPRPDDPEGFPTTRTIGHAVKITVTRAPVTDEDEDESGDEDEESDDDETLVTDGGRSSSIDDCHPALLVIHRSRDDPDAVPSAAEVTEAITDYLEEHGWSNPSDLLIDVREGTFEIQDEVPPEDPVPWYGVAAVFSQTEATFTHGYTGPFRIAMDALAYAFEDCEIWIDAVPGASADNR